MCTMIWSVRWYSALRMAIRTAPALVSAGDGACTAGFAALTPDEDGFVSGVKTLVGANTNAKEKIKDSEARVGRRSIARLRGTAFNFEKEGSEHPRLVGGCRMVRFGVKFAGAGDAPNFDAPPGRRVGRLLPSLVGEAKIHAGGKDHVVRLGAENRRVGDVAVAAPRLPAAPFP